MISVHDKPWLLTALALCGLGLAGCDEMTRFRHEKFACGPNPAGLVEIVLNSQKKGSEARIEFLDRQTEARLAEVSDRLFVLETASDRFQLDRQTGEIILTTGTRFLQLSCTRTVFTM